MTNNLSSRFLLICTGMIATGLLTGAALQEKETDAKPENSDTNRTVTAAASESVALDAVPQSDPVGNDTVNSADPFSGPAVSQPGPSTRNLPCEADNNLRSLKVLDRVYNMPPMQGVPLSEFIQEISEAYQIPTLIDLRALEEEGADPESEVNWNLTGIRLRTALEMVLEQTDLAYKIKDGILIVTTKTDAEDRQSTRVYNCQELLQAIMNSKQASESAANVPTDNDSNMKEIVNIIETCVEPLSWENNGGPAGAKVVAFQNKMIIRNLEAVHHEIRLLLDELAQ